MKLLFILLSCVGVLSSGYIGQIVSDQKKTKDMDKFIPDHTKGDAMLKSQNMPQKQSRTYSMW